MFKAVKGSSPKIGEAFNKAAPIERIAIPINAIKVRRETLTTFPRETGS